MEIPCPLCCNQKFSSHSSLKRHILSLLHNLACPTCYKNFDGLIELAGHLNECKEKKPAECFKNNTHSDTEIIDRGSHLYEKVDNIKCDEVAEEEQHQISENDDAEDDNDNNYDCNVENNDGEYFCEMCRVHFDDITQHLEQYHDGQEIILEDQNFPDDSNTFDNEDNSTLPEEEIFIVHSEINDVDDDDEDNDDDANSVIVTDTEDPIKTPKLKTVEQTNVIDKDGRLYVRKIVKIDKFWLPENDSKLESSQEPSLQQFIVSDGEVALIADNEIKQLEDTSEMSEINQCSNCKLLFAGVEAYEKHKCDAKSANVSKKESGEVDKAKSNKNNGPFHCDECNTTLATFKSLRLHKRMHEPIKSRLCDAPVNYGIELETIREDDGRERETFVCEVCNKTYDKEYEEVHMNSHSVKNQYNCNVCNRKFHTEANLEMHMKAHSNNKKFVCSYCRKPFVTYDALQDHLTNQCQKREYACHYCGRRFSRPHEKVKHERIHTGEKPHVCDICGKAFRVSYCLTLHLRTHSGTRPYQCKHCSKRFKSHSVYTHHLLTHSDERKYKCPFCPKAFKTSVQLAGHKNCHIKPFSCTLCNRPFASLYAVRTHMNSHKKDNNLKYECYMCGALYSRTFALRDHIREQHHDASGEKAQVLLRVDEEIEAANSILVKEDDIILGLENDESMEVIENE